MNTWTRFHSKDELIAALDRELSQVPGIAYNFTQPMAMRLDETVSGVKADLAVKIFGDDFAHPRRARPAGAARRRGRPGAADAQMEITSGVAELSVRPTAPRWRATA